MKIAILGTRGVPNYHGGFEQFTEFFSVYLVEKGHEVYVYNSNLHPYKESTFKGVHIIHCKDYEDKIGTAGQFFYDLNCIRDSRKRGFDIILQLGYTSSSIWHRWLPKSSIIITNMDGLEWKRSKYKRPVQKFLKYAEKLAVKSSDYLVADSVGIQNYLKEEYGVGSSYIAYGAEIFENATPGILDEYKLEIESYNMLIARMEPENNIEVILDGVSSSNSDMPFLVIGKYDTNDFGAYLREKYKNDDRIRFLGGIYNQEHLNVLRYFSNLYFHGHSVGGTNPSLLEAMASNTLIIANNNIFNEAILESNAFYFDTHADVKKHIESTSKKEHLDKVRNAKITIENKFNLNRINQQYLDLFEKAMNQSQ